MEMKVFNGWTMKNGKQVAVIVAASSQRKASAALAEFGIDASVRAIQSYWAITGNKKHCEVALAVPGQAFAASSLDSDDYKPLPRKPLAKVPQLPKTPTDPEGKRLYDKNRREASDKNKRERGERRISSWLPPEAAAALDRLTGGDESRGAVRAALVLALTTCAATQEAQKAA
jgi:hypothetical protein